jgi:DNA modification methylase
MSEPQSFLEGKVILHMGDCLDVMAALEPNSIDACVCDPPYHLQSIVRRFAKTGRTDKTRTTSGPHQRTANGFMNKVWDGGDIAFQVATWEAVWRVLKPGAYIIAFSLSRTFGRMSVAIEDAGFITHPLIGWIFGQGFPKAHNAAKAIDRELGARGGVSPTGDPVRRIRPGADQNADGTWEKLEDREYQPGAYEPATDEARAWLGFSYGGQALKPALEPIYVGQKPFSERNGALNILKHGVGALNIDGCRIPLSAEDSLQDGLAGDYGRLDPTDGWGFRRVDRPAGLGRWPANIVHDGSPEVVAMFPETSSGAIKAGTPYNHGNCNTMGAASGTVKSDFAADHGSAARFFYSAKADSDDRLGSKHPTVKPVDLMQWLCKLVTPPGGMVLDPFAGTGTTGAAAWRDGFRSVLIEREAEYCADIARRMKLELCGPDERARESVKARHAGKPIDHGPLFGGAE